MTENHRPAKSLSPAMREILAAQVRVPEVVAELARVWVIARGEYDEREPVSVVNGTEADAQREADRYNAEVSWTTEADKAHVWNSVPFVGPPVQG
ncbi:hypothetical protein [Nocardia fluminea]|uniref:hypothetical protein n=1 Tax=Nocardia fluminea TaxID=134984 RepID=UPI003669F36F